VSVLVDGNEPSCPGLGRRLESLWSLSRFGGDNGRDDGPPAGDDAIGDDDNEEVSFPSKIGTCEVRLVSFESWLFDRKCLRLALGIRSMVVEASSKASAIVLGLGSSTLPSFTSKELLAIDL
jgi:hypothetical protein